MRIKVLDDVGLLEIPDYVVFSGDYMWVTFTPFPIMAGKRYAVSLICGGIQRATTSVVGNGASIEVSTVINSIRAFHWTAKGYVDGVEVMSWDFDLSVMDGKSYSDRTHYADRVVYGGDGLQFLMPFDKQVVTLPDGTEEERKQGDIIELDRCEGGEVSVACVPPPLEVEWNNGLIADIECWMVLPDAGASGLQAERYEREGVRKYVLEPWDGLGVSHTWRIYDVVEYRYIGAYITLDPFNLMANCVNVVDIYFYDEDPNEPTRTDRAYIINGAFHDDVVTVLQTTAVNFGAERQQWRLAVDGEEVGTNIIYLTTDGYFVEGDNMVVQMPTVANLGELFSEVRQGTAYTNFPTEGGEELPNVCELTFADGAESWNEPADFFICPNRANNFGYGIVFDAVSQHNVSQASADGYICGRGVSISHSGELWTYDATVDDALLWAEVFPQNLVTANVIAPRGRLISWATVDLWGHTTAGNVAKLTTAKIIEDPDSGEVWRYVRGGRTLPPQVGKSRLLTYDVGGQAGDPFFRFSQAVGGEVVANNTRLEVLVCDTPICTPINIGDFGGEPVTSLAWQIVPPPPCYLDFVEYKNADGMRRYLYGHVTARQVVVERDILPSVEAVVKHPPFAVAGSPKVVITFVALNVPTLARAEDVLTSPTIKINDVSGVISTSDVSINISAGYADITLEIVTNI